MIKVLLPIIVALNMPLQAQMSKNSGISKAQADSRYVNSPTESVAQTFTGLLSGTQANFSILKAGEGTFNGNVGIGTATPGSKLQVKNAASGTSFSINASDDANIFFIAEGADGRGYVAVRDTSASTKVFLDSAGSSYLTGGNVGIGTDTPGSKLEVNGAAHFTSSVTIMGNIGYAGGSVVQAFGGELYMGDLDALNTNTVFRAAGTDVLSMSGSAVYLGGRPGYGTGGIISTYTTSTGELNLPKLKVSQVQVKNAASGAQFSINASDDANIFFIAEGADGRGYVAVRDTSASTKVWLDSAGSSYLTGGNVGIGTTVPASKLHMSSGVYINDGNSYGLFVGTTTTTNAAARIVGRANDEYVLKLSSSTGDASIGFHQNGHFSLYGAKPTLGTCANATITGRDSAFYVTFSGANSSCEIGFGEAYDAMPTCVSAGKLTTFGETPVFATESSTGTLIVPATGAWESGDIINVICMGVH